MYFGLIGNRTKIVYFLWVCQVGLRSIQSSIELKTEGYGCGRQRLEIGYNGGSRDKYKFYCEGEKA